MNSYGHPGFIYRREKGIVAGSSLRETAAFKVVVMHDGVTLGIGKSSVISSGWACLEVNREDPVDVALAPRVQHYAIAHVA